MNLVIVESPAKIKPLKNYLGKEYDVISSVGHIRDLNTTGSEGLGIDIDNSFEGKYKIITGKSKIVKEMQQKASKFDKVLIATDPDREGEAIGWHIYEIIKDFNNNIYRIEFNEITKDAVLDAVSKPHELNMDLVYSQETRRMTDRVIGFRLSKIMKKSIGAQSAGRVQSVALKLILEREIERRNFVPQKYYEIFAKYKSYEIAYEKNADKLSIEDSQKIFEKLSEDILTVKDIKEQEKIYKSPYPFVTASMQRAASSKLGFSAKKTMSVAQKLYEGKNIGSETTGLITYMRTDSPRLSQSFIKEGHEYIEKTWGSEYSKFYAMGIKKGAQDGHEAIRPTKLKNDPEKIKNFLSNDEYKLYKLIFEQAIASLMADNKTKIITTIFTQNGINFKYAYSVDLFEGFKKVIVGSKQAKPLKLNVGETIKPVKFSNDEKETNPPALFSEAALIKLLEEKGIGRPSTYVSIIDTLKKRAYVDFVKKQFHITELGEEVCNELEKTFPNFIEVDYTAHLEEELDQIAQGDNSKLDVIQKFYDEFTPKYEQVMEKIKSSPKTEKVYDKEKCPNCGADLVIKRGKFGEFAACSTFPKCKYTKSLVEAKVIGKCPKCEVGNVIEKRTKRNKIFYGCDKYPKCDYASWDKPKL